MYSPKPFYDVCFITDGQFDFGDILSKECIASNIPRPSYMCSCHNIKTYYKFYYKQKYYKNITDMLRYLGMDFEGTQHNGYYDSLNVARIVQHMLRKTYAKFDKNEFY